jgi:hypothetical protein
LHQARNDAERLVALLSRGAPTDGLQLAGTAILTAGVTADFDEVISDLASKLHDRGWLGDVELATALTERVAGRPSALTSLAVDLDDLAELLDAQPSSESYIDLSSGAVWPGEIIDLGEGPDDLDPGDASRWLFVRGEGSQRAYADMERFIATVEPEPLGVKLREAITGKQPFKTFLNVLQRNDDQFTSWHRHRDDARIGRARHWLAAHGFEPART